MKIVIPMLGFGRSGGYRVLSRLASLWAEWAAADPQSMIMAHRKTFDALLRQASIFLGRGDLNRASLACAQAARFASHYHCGFMASWELDSLISETSRASIDPRIPNEAVPPTSPRIAHIITTALSVGGHTRLAARWMRFDVENSHDLIITDPFHTQIPTVLAEAVANSGGKVYLLDRRRHDDPLAKASEIRKIVAGARAIVLHTNPYDICPLLALGAGPRPPAIYLNHTDHLFWAGSTLVDVVADLRASGARLSATRRMVSPEQQVLLPIPIDVPDTVTPEEKSATKARLGFHDNEILLVSVASAYKYNAPRGRHFVDVLLPLTLRHDNLRVLAIGPECTSRQWLEAQLASAGRLKALGAIPDIVPYLIAADGYVDSFPMGSLTATLEAGAHALPVVSMEPISGYETLSCDSPGLDRAIVRSKSLPEFRSAVERMILDADWRRARGALLQSDIRNNHGQIGWPARLATVYAAASHSRRTPRPQDKHPRSVDEERLTLDHATFRMSRLTSLRGRLLYRLRMAQTIVLGRRRPIQAKQPG